MPSFTEFKFSTCIEQTSEMDVYSVVQMRCKHSSRHRHRETRPTQGTFIVLHLSATNRFTSSNSRLLQSTYHGAYSLRGEFTDAQVDHNREFAHGVRPLLNDAILIKIAAPRIRAGGSLSSARRRLFRSRN